MIEQISWQLVLVIVVIITALVLITKAVFDTFNIKVEYVDLSHITKLNKRVVLLSDQHLGVLKGEKFVRRTVNIINRLGSIDYVFHVGDFSEAVSIDKLEQSFSPYSNIAIPQYAVLGNHDFEQFGNPLTKLIYDKTAYYIKMVESLEKNNIKVIDNMVIDMIDFNLAGLSSRYSNFQDFSIYDGLVANRLNNNRIKESEASKNFVNANNSLSNFKPTITLAHEPYNFDLVPSGVNTLMFSGHTHYGQVEIPIVDKFIVPKDPQYSKLDNYHKGLYTNIDKGSLFIGKGLGESTLPFRFNSSPTIYVIEI